MYELFDQFCWTKQNKTITHDKHLVNGLGNFTYWNYKESPAPSPMHFHSDIIEIHCLLKGQRTSLIEDEGTISKYVYYGNEAFLTFPFEIHGNGDQPQLPCELYAFQLITNNPNQLLGLNKEYSNSLYTILMNLQNRHVKLGLSHIQYLRTAFNFFSDFSCESIRIGVQFLTCFLFSLQYLTPVHKTGIRQVDSHILKSIHYLNQNITEPIRLEDLSLAAGYSLSRFKFKFKQEVGITPAEYISIKKIERAKNLLDTTNLSITEIAYSLGFSTSNYFSSVFRKYMNCTPKNYRKKQL